MWCYNYYSQQHWPTVGEGKGRDIEGEVLLDGDGIEKGEKVVMEVTEVEVRVEKESTSLKPTVEKVVTCAVILRFITLEVALETS